MITGYIIQTYLRNCSWTSEFGTDLENFIFLWQRKLTNNTQWSDFQRCWTLAALPISIAALQGWTQLSLCSLPSTDLFTTLILKLNLRECIFQRRKYSSACALLGCTQIPVRACLVVLQPQTPACFTAWILQLSHCLYYIETCSFMRKIKDLRCEPHLMPCGFVYDFYSPDRQSSFSFKEDIKPNFCLWLFYETCRKLIFRESLAHWSHLTDGYTDTTQTQGLHKPEIPKESS